MCAVVLGRSSGDLPSCSSSASETVVVDGVDIFLNLRAVRLCGGSANEFTGAIGISASRTKTRVAYLDASRVISASFRVSDAFLAVRTVAVHDCDNHMSLEMLDGRERQNGLAESCGLG